MAICGGAASVALAARSREIAHGTAGGVAPWVLTVSTRTLGHAHLPAVCSSLLWGDAPGSRVGSGFPDCLAADQGYFVGNAVHYRFSLEVQGFHGVAPMAEERGTPNFRGVSAIVVPSATRVIVTFDNDSRVRMSVARLPRALHLPFRIAWSAMVGNWNTAAIKVKRIDAYDRHGHLVGFVKGDGPRISRHG